MNILAQAQPEVYSGPKWWDIAIPLSAFIILGILHIKGKNGKDPLPKVSSVVDFFAIKLWFRVSRCTVLEPAQIIKNILLLLDERRYNVIGATDDSITFKERPWVLMWNFQAVRRLDGGYFKIDLIDKEQPVTLNYYFNVFPFVIAFAAMEILTVCNGFYDGTLFFAIGFPVICVIHGFVIKGIAKEMLREILNS